MDEKDYAARVRNLKASRFLYRADVIARVESEDDIAFWQKAIHHVRPSVKVKFIPAEVSDSNTKQRGKTLCMKLVEYLDQHFIICVDSDFDKFLHPGLLVPAKHILQTHAYSWENHHCQKENLQKQWNLLNTGTFDFEMFLVKFSCIIYPALIGILTAKKCGVRSWSLDSLCSELLKVRVNQKRMLENNGELLLQVIGSKVQAWKNSQQLLNDADYDMMKKQASDIGMVPDNSYLYMQGHCVYDLLLRIGNFLCNGKNDFMYEVLKPAYQMEGYQEMEMIKSDIGQIL